MFSSSNFLDLRCVLVLCLSARFALGAGSQQCHNDRYTSYNASGSVSIDGFTLGNSSRSNWTISAALKDAGPGRGVYTTAWIDTNPFVDLSSDTLPYLGCVVTLGGLAQMNPSTGNTGGTSCNGVLSSSCQQALSQMVSSNVAGNLASNYTTQEKVCKGLISNVPAACKDNAWGVSSTDFVFGNHSNLNSGNSTCPSSVSLGNGSAADGSFDSWGWSSGAGGTDLSTPNYHDYDSVVIGSVPMIFTAWTKGYAGSKGGEIVTTMVCVTPKNLQAGSRNPSAAGRLGGKSGLAMAVAAIVALVTLV